MEFPADDALIAALKAAIVAAGGVAAVARKTGIPVGTLNKYAAGTSMPSFSNAAKIAFAANVPLERLAAAGDAAFPQPQVQPNPIAIDEWVMEELAKIAEREHKAAGQPLPPIKVAVEAGVLYNELLALIRNVTDRRTVGAMLPILTENLRNKLREAAAKPGSGKREAS